MKKKQKKELEIKAIDACADYLRSVGWNPLIGGFAGIEQGERKYKFILRFIFTGKPPFKIPKSKKIGSIIEPPKKENTN